MGNGWYMTRRCKVIQKNKLSKMPGIKFKYYWQDRNLYLKYRRRSDMRSMVILILLALTLVFSCSKKETAVKSMEGLQPLELLEKGNRAYLDGNMEEALQAYGVIYNRYPTSREYIDAVLGMARAYNNMGDFERGFNLLYDLIRENMVPSRVPEIYNEMAKYYEVSALYGKQIGTTTAEEDYKKALSYYQN